MDNLIEHKQAEVLQHSNLPRIPAGNVAIAMYQTKGITFTDKTLRKEQPSDKF